MSQFEDRIIALAAMAQAVTLVQQVAETGNVNNDELETLLGSLVNENAQTTAELYGGLDKLQTGFKQLIRHLGKDKQQQDMMLLRYMIGLLHLERKLAKHPEMLQMIGREIDQVPQQISYFGAVSHPQVISRLADVYQRSISQLTPRILVQGKDGFLQQTENADKVRALLLSGIRAALLWYQKGGRRWHFIFGGSKMLNTAQLMLEHR